MEFSTLSADSFEVKITRSKICTIGTVLVLTLEQPSRFSWAKPLVELVFATIPFPLQIYPPGLPVDCRSVLPHRDSSVHSMGTLTLSSAKAYGTWKQPESGLNVWCLQKTKWMLGRKFSRYLWWHESSRIMEPPWMRPTERKSEPSRHHNDTAEKK